MLELCDEQIEWVSPIQALEPGARIGKDTIREGYKAYEESFDEFLPEAREILETPTPGTYLVLATTHVRGRRSGASVSIDIAHLITIRDGLMTRLQVVIDRSEARRIAGIAEDT